MDYLATFVHIHLGYIPLLVMLLPLLRKQWRVWSSYLILIVLAYGAYIGYVGGDWSVGRFFVPLMPLYCTLLAGGLVVAGQWLAAQLRKWRTVPTWIPSGLAVLTIVALIAGTFAWSSLGGEKALFLDRFDARLAGQARTAMGVGLREQGVGLVETQGAHRDGGSQSPSGQHFLWAIVQHDLCRSQAKPPADVLTLDWIGRRVVDG